MPTRQARRDLTLAYSAFPCAVLPPTGQKPTIFNSFRAFLQASHHVFSALCANAFLARADAALLTILPLLLLVNVSFVKPPVVFCLEPFQTMDRAIFPRATTLLRFAFMAFMAFMVFMAFMAFMALMAFMAFMVAFMAAFMPTAFITTFIAPFIAPPRAGKAMTAKNKCASSRWQAA